MMPSSLRRLVSSPRHAPLLLVVAFALAVASCHGEEGRIRKRLAGEYVSTIDHIVGGLRARERHVLRLTEDGYWIRIGRTQVADRPVKASRDSGTYRVEGPMITLRSQLETSPMTLRYAVAGDTISGYNGAMYGMNKEGVFIRR